MTADSIGRLVECCREMVAAHEQRNPRAILLTERERAALTALYVETCYTFDRRMNEVAAA